MQRTNVVVYTGKSVPCINVIASYNPEVKRRLMICTHWDADRLPTVMTVQWQNQF
jgi:glutaminyl-peptide cyclotransferase